ncbi:hypothetical protein BDV93DRAFT_523993 [Ceratobasidium sp. AG-I]|nr:hypothetical protein BDV93DRAFT_523993 [Ceratobasidium sp. AG-I]
MSTLLHAVVPAVFFFLHGYYVLSFISLASEVILLVCSAALCGSSATFSILHYG